jgi:hypothetical protein
VVDFASGEWILPGEKRVFTLNGTAPKETGSSQIGIGFMSPFWLTHAFVEQKVGIEWK